ncbi:beta-1,4 N-acetylgalactosaminyltransferase 2-like [Etheostoma cragini]|uniref:beta-1,4 N-acetylgalactosaminyltransferase 2-like n=1 Tax=Etheostoma cragini TaxID=417921 RepID=UPI00155E0BF4|nr:beta-1,4 N-acetylgalactosaminyltransferase 2-like [Etheostoma cragini]
MKAVNTRTLWRAAVVCGIILAILYFMTFHNCSGKLRQEVPTAQKRLANISSQRPSPPPGPCTCAAGAEMLKDYIPKDQYEKLAKRRAKEFQQHKARTTSVLSRLLIALPNSPLQYPIQGFTVRPLIPTPIPGLALHAGQRSSYKVSLNVSKGVQTTKILAEDVKVQGGGGPRLIMESSSLVILNEALAKVSYASTVYHIHTGDLASFQFEDHEAVFPITIRQPRVPVLHDMGTDVSSHVTVATKTFLRYPQLRVLLRSLRRFYSNVEVIIADDSYEPENITGEHIRQYFMPPAQGTALDVSGDPPGRFRGPTWMFQGAHLDVSVAALDVSGDRPGRFRGPPWMFQGTTLDVSGDRPGCFRGPPWMFQGTTLDVSGALGGAVQGNQFYFSLLYEEGEEMEGGCLHRKSQDKFQSLPGYPKCFLASGVVNFFLARTDAVQRVGFDPQLQRVAHSEFFMDGLGSLLVATCDHVSIDHQPKTGNKDNARYGSFRNPGRSDVDFKLQLHYFKNHLKCIKYG